METDTSTVTDNPREEQELPVYASNNTSKIVEAAEKRARDAVHDEKEEQYDREHDMRQAFRRLIDPGILRPNSKEAALASLQTLSRIADNLLKEPDNEKYRRFKPTNAIIKRTLVETVGALEYAIALGFRPEVENFQPFYVHSHARLRDLTIGAAILKEAIELATEKERRLVDARSREREAVQLANSKVKMNYEEDRKAKRLRDEMDKERRETRTAHQYHMPFESELGNES